MLANLGQSLDTVGTDQLYPLGSTYYEPPPYVADGTDDALLPANSGGRVYVYVKNAEASTAFAQGNIIIRSATTAQGILSTTTLANNPRHRVMGVAQWAIAAGSYGWIVAKGVCEVLTGATTGTTTVREIVVNENTAGTARVMAGGEEHLTFGFAIDTVGASSGLATAVVNCPGA